MNKNVGEAIRKCMDCLGGVFAHEDCRKILLYIVSIKFIIDNKKIPLTNENFDVFLDAQRMLDKAELDKDIITTLNYVIENHFGIGSGSLTEFSNFYFRVVELKKSQKINIVEELKSVTFENESDAVISSLKTVLRNHATSFGRMMSNEISTQSISELIRELIALENDEKFADFTYGLGLSSLEITKEVNCRLEGYDINKQTSTMAQMLLIVAGKENFKIYNEDITTVNITVNSVDKIATIPPFGMKVRDLELGGAYLLQEFGLPVKPCNLEVLIALQGIKSLKENGKMILAVTPNMLFSATTVEKKFRELMTQSYLSAVITLPSLYYGTNIATNLIILEKNRKLDQITFIDASSNEHFTFANKDKKSQNELTDGAINKISEIIRESETIKGISYCCSTDEIEENYFSLVPSRYVQTKRKRETLSNSEIDKRLQHLYAEINQMTN